MVKKTLHKAKSFLKRCTKKLSKSVGTLEAHKLCGKLVKRRKVRTAKLSPAQKAARARLRRHAGHYYVVYYKTPQRGTRQTLAGAKSYEGPFTLLTARDWIKADGRRYDTPRSHYKIWSRKPW